MQSIYAMHQNSSDSLEKEEKFLFFSLENSLDLYLIMLSCLIEIKKTEALFLDKSSKKHLSTSEERNPNLKFTNNLVFKFLEESNSLSIALENRKINNWELVKKLFEIIGPKYKSRAGGYTRITKLPRRMSDGSKMAVIEFV